MKRKVNEKKSGMQTKVKVKNYEMDKKERRKEDERMREQEDKIIAVERKMKNENK